MFLFILYSLLLVSGNGGQPKRANSKLREIQSELVRLLKTITEEEKTITEQEKPKKQPHILFFLADDLGWANVGYHSPNNKEVDTPTMNKLVSQGVELDRFYSFNQCGPSRSALLSGRNSQHVNHKNSGSMAWNPQNPVSGYGGVPPNMTMMGSKMKKAGYKTGYTGKWDVGFASTAQMPYNKGFDKFFGYLQHANSFCSTKTPVQAVGGVDVCQSRFFDLWEMDADGHRPSPLAGTAYEEEFFLQHSLDIINEHDPSENPLFLFHSSHLVHSPLQIPEVWLKNFTFMDIKGNSDHFRRQYAAMVQYMDMQIKALVDALKEKKMWENTLFIFMSDNGGPVYSSAAANNFPLRGSKLADWEGGIRVNAFVSGGLIPRNVQGTKSEELGHISDWYTTLCNLAGVNPEDKLAEEYDLPPVEGIDLWPMITQTGPGRDEIYISEKTIIMGKYKLMTGMHGFDIRTGPGYPNNTCGDCTEDMDTCEDCRQPGGNSGYWLPCNPDGTCTESARGSESFAKFEAYPQELEHLGGWVTDCEADGKIGCLFNIHEDPSEYEDLSARPQYRQLMRRMLKQLKVYQDTNFNPDRGHENYLACIAGFYYGGYVGPFLNEHGKPLWEATSQSQASPSCDACEVKPLWPADEHCVFYPDVNRGFMCTPYINGQCSEPATKTRTKGQNAPVNARFLCGSKERSWAENIGGQGEFYFAETEDQDLMVQNFWAKGNPSNEFPFPDTCPVLGIEPAAIPLNIRRK